MKIAGREFAPAWWATLLALAGFASTIALGFWQLGRADTKAALQARLDDFARQPPITLGVAKIQAEDVLLRRVQVRGRFEPSHGVFLDNHVYKHQPGYHVLTPLRLTVDGATAKYVLVNRGWIAAGGERGRTPEVKTPEGEVAVSGNATPYSERFMELSSKVAEGNIWQNMVLERYRQATKLDVLPVILQQTSAADDGLVRDWPPLDLKRNTHLAYAVQWFALAAAILIGYVALNVRRTIAEHR